MRTAAFVAAYGFFTASFFAVMMSSQAVSKSSSQVVLVHRDERAECVRDVGEAVERRPRL